MAQNKNALIRYRTIDKCLQNSYRNWTLEDLIEACSDALYEYEGKDANVSKRTIQLDIQLMRSDKLGYNAPIEVYDKKFYRYEDPDFTITDIPLNENDMHVLSETVEMLKQFKDFSLFSELGGIIQRLEDKIYTEKTHRPAIIHLDKNDQLKGLEHLDVLYQAILKKMVLKLRYQSFKANESSVITFHPFILKEFNNRWFLVGKKNKKGNILTFALDRIISIDYDTKLDYINENFDGDAFYKNTIGVTVLDEKHIDRIVLKVDEKNAPYVLTKPLHHTQRVKETLNNGAVIIELSVHQNFELERLILGFGEAMQVLKPISLKRRIQEKFQNGLDMYNSQLSASDALAASKKLVKNGYSILNDLYTRNEIRKIGKELHDYFADNNESTFGKRTLLKDIPSLKALLFNENLERLVRTIDPDAFLVKAIYFDKPDDSNWFVSWHQDVPINVQEKIETDGFTSWTKKKEINSVCPPEEFLHNIFTIRIHLDITTEQNGALKVVPGSHTKRFTDDELSVITANTRPVLIEVREGGVQLMKPLLLHSSSKTQNQKRRRVIHLEFSSLDLPNKLEWLERDTF
ncbi:WYL domain-containing protein [Fluviicola taffensis]|uniref:Phytanoyl-CoA dioxygenase n=1 Tax=Fluviicola taffensis (strain DSM 16823 / NCIMB 13979 / RW262) TaxID=755732 RepID=F2IGF9_FLUTR|nr:Phytanoyl-CoA dioxygenase [Fluviicola taffensis DSM 16823]